MKPSKCKKGAERPLRPRSGRMNCRNKKKGAKRPLRPRSGRMKPSKHKKGAERPLRPRSGRMNPRNKKGREAPFEAAKRPNAPVDAHLLATKSFCAKR
ncbi:hypothetical protein niasHS_009635 [Heterodera schachtii]|uniref:Uncharacterized protein n=1 Tax=Heterodera schachtii TaxID=97005 RepID=A0ABD2JEC2_HETSC